MFLIWKKKHLRNTTLEKTTVEKQIKRLIRRLQNFQSDIFRRVENLTEKVI